LKDLTPEKLYSLVLVALVSLTVFGWLRFSILAAGLVFHPAPLMADEGLLTYQVSALAAGELYAPIAGEAFAITSIPPIFHYILAVLGTVLPIRLAGRLVSTLAAVAVAVLLSLVILESQLWNRRGARRRTPWNVAWASYIGVSFICLFPMTTWSFVNQVECLALAFGLLGILGWLRGVRGEPHALAYGMVAFLLAATTKQGYAVLPILCAVSWSFSDWPKAMRFLGGWFVSAGVMALALYAATDGWIAVHLQTHTKSWGIADPIHLATVLDFLMGPMGWLTVLGTGGVFWPYYTGRRDPVAYAMPFFWISGWCWLFGGHVDGVSFELSLLLLVALWLGLGVWMDELSRYLRGERGSGVAASWLAVVVVAVSLIGTLTHMLIQPLTPLRSADRYASRGGYAHVLNEVGIADGPVLAEDVAVLMDAGVEVEVADLRRFTLLARSGQIDGSWLTAALNAERYALVVLTTDVHDYAASSLTRGMKDALLANYTVWSETDYAVLYRPTSKLVVGD
jgi:hypothetical protein